MTINKGPFIFTASFSRWGLGVVVERMVLHHVIRIYLIHIFIQMAWISKKRRGD